MRPRSRVDARAALAGAALVGLAGCCTPPSDRVILLPGTAGRATGAVLVTPQAATGAASGAASAPTVRLDAPYRQVEVGSRGGARESTTTAAAIERGYGRLLAMKPAEAVRWVLEFEPGTDTLTPRSQAELPQVLDAMKSYPVGELVVEGHTDRVGGLESNDRLSLERAQAVQRMLVDAGVAVERIQAVGRGERAPLVPTADEVSEARNRRVEIRLR